MPEDDLPPGVPADGGAAVGEQDAGKPRRGRRPGCVAGCLCTALGLVIAMALFALWWSSRLGAARREFSAQVRKLEQEYHDARPVVLPEDDAAPLYVAAFPLYVAPANESLCYVSKIDGAKPEELEKYMTDNAGYLAALKKAVARPGFVSGTRISQGVNARLPFMQPFREAARFLSVAAVREARAGRPGEALELVRMMLRIARDADDDGLLISHLVSIASESMTVATLEKVLDGGAPSEEELRRTLEALDARVRGRRSMAEIFRAERIWALVTFEQLAGGRQSLGGLAGTGVGPGLAQRAWQLTGGPIRDGRALAALAEEAAEIAGKPLHQAVRDLEKLDRRVELGASHDFPWSSMGMFAPTYCRPVISEGRVLARMHAARLGLGCRMFKIRTGAYPAKLEDLSATFPELFKELPADPFTGEPMKYARTETGFRIWSVSDDGTDHGGTKRGPGTRNACDEVFELTR